jgi:hypothetical protein
MYNKMDINKIFNLFEGINKDIPDDDNTLLVDFSEHPLYWIGGFNKLINNYIYFNKYLVDKSIDKDRLEISNILLYNRAWEYIKRLDTNNSLHLDCLKVKSNEFLDIALDSTIKFFEKYEEYEKCAFLKNIQEKVKDFLI